MSGGFSLIELLIVVSIVLLLATIGAPLLLKRAKTAALTTTLAELEMLCRCAQHIACASNAQQSVTLDLQRNTCTLTTKQQSWHVELPKTCSFGFLPDALGPPSEPVKKITQAVTFPAEKSQFKILFQPTGVISPGTAYIIDKQESQLGALTCGVSQVSYIRKYVYNNRTWHLLKK
jgi:prepilin-type N-terminal cleavage/methylation domain-containing protein